MGSNEQLAEYKDSFFRMASSALSASKVGWTRARQVGNFLCREELSSFTLFGKTVYRISNILYPLVHHSASRQWFILLVMLSRINSDLTQAR